jgi:hypothetical protein
MPPKEYDAAHTLIQQALTTHATQPAIQTEANNMQHYINAVKTRVHQQTRQLHTQNKNHTLIARDPVTRDNLTKAYQAFQDGINLTFEALGHTQPIRTNRPASLHSPAPTPNKASTLAHIEITFNASKAHLIAIHNSKHTPNATKYNTTAANYLRSTQLLQQQVTSYSSKTRTDLDELQRRSVTLLATKQHNAHKKRKHSTHTTYRQPFTPYNPMTPTTPPAITASAKRITKTHLKLLDLVTTLQSTALPLATHTHITTHNSPKPSPRIYKKTHQTHSQTHQNLLQRPAHAPNQFRNGLW